MENKMLTQLVLARMPAGKTLTQEMIDWLDSISDSVFTFHATNMPTSKVTNAQIVRRVKAYINAGGTPPPNFRDSLIDAGIADANDNPLPD